MRNEASPRRAEPFSRVPAMLLAFALLAASGRAGEPDGLSSLGSFTNWFLTFVNDPFDKLTADDLEVKPELMAQAIAKVVVIPGDDEAGKWAPLLLRFNGKDEKALPKAFRTFVKGSLKTWRKERGAKDVKELVVERPPQGADPVKVRRAGKKLLVPPAALGYAYLRAVRDEGGLAALFMWTLSHPSYAQSRASRSSPAFQLTPDGKAFYRSRRPDVAAACEKVLATFDRNLKEVFDSGMVP